MSDTAALEGEVRNAIANYLGAYSRDNGTATEQEETIGTAIERIIGTVIEATYEVERVAAEGEA